MKILLFGSNGQVGSELRNSLNTLGKVFPSSRKDKSLPCDLSDLSSISSTIRKVKPDLLVNASAYTKVDQAEEDIELAFLVNSEAPKVMSKESKILGIPLIHYSTDYVYKNDSEDFINESQEAKPLSIYGQSKLEGDNYVLKTDGGLVLRTSWVYSPTGNNFLRTILNLAKNDDPLRVIGDQVGTPTSSFFIAKITTDILNKMKGNNPINGIFHCTPRGVTNWYDYVKLIISCSRDIGFNIPLSDSNIIKIKSDQYKTRAIRPKNSRLSIKKLELTLGYKMPKWENDVKICLKEIFEHEK